MLVIRLGLCCTFVCNPIRFRRTTATSLLRVKRSAALKKIADICKDNAEALKKALVYCQAHGIGSFRINSQILPVKTHPEAGYEIGELPHSNAIVNAFLDCGRFAREHDIRLSLHPDQLIVLNSPVRTTVERSTAELAYHTEVASWVGADVIIIHGGGSYGDKKSALVRLRTALQRLAPEIRELIAIENDDRVFTPADLLPLCRMENIPMVYDIHHHRCLPDDKTVEETTDEAIRTWRREPLFHISSPLWGWHGAQPERHHDFVNPRDFPRCWLDRTVTVEVEAKAKELAVMKLMRDLERTKPGSILRKPGPLLSSCASASAHKEKARPILQPRG
jgi:UV DNA damage endonuclease